MFLIPDVGTIVLFVIIMTIASKVSEWRKKQEWLAREEKFKKIREAHARARLTGQSSFVDQLTGKTILYDAHGLAHSVKPKNISEN